MFRTYQYRLYPNQTQERALRDLLYAARQLYNHALAHRRERWEESRHTVSYQEQAALWRDWRNEDAAHNPLQKLNMTAGQQVLRRLDSAYHQFLGGTSSAGKRGKPRFKAAKYFHSVSYQPGDGTKLREGQLYVQNVGLIKIKQHRALPWGLLKNVILTQRNEHWYVSLQFEMMESLWQPELPRSSGNEFRPGPAVGIDVGLHHALALSDDRVIDSPQPLKRSLKKLRVAQRTVSRRQTGSQRRQKAVRQLAHRHEHVAHQRRDFWHKVTRALVSRYGLIAVEDLSLKFMLVNDRLARTAHDVGLGLFAELLAYKAMEAGCEVIAVDPRNTSQACSGCGCLVPKDLSVRVHTCPDCSLVLDRDVNAARNILSLAHPPGRGGQALTWATGPGVA